MPSTEDGASARRHPHPYAGRWIARIRWQIVGQGGTPRQALAAAYSSRFKEKPILSYIPFERLMAFHPIVFEIQRILASFEDVYLVGGAVRDALLGRTGHDLDFVCLNSTRRAARKVADELTGDIFTLDDERDIYRVILTDPEGNPLLVDFSAARGTTLEEDLNGRDFSINAMAVDIRDPYKLIDPLVGAQALNAKILEACGPKVILDDPIRLLRGVRFASQWTFRLEDDTRRQMKEAAVHLAETTVERRREEFLKILAGSRPAVALRALDWFGVLETTLPGLGTYRQSAGKDAWETTLAKIQDAHSLLNLLLVDDQPTGEATDYRSGLAAMKLGRFRPEVRLLFEARDLGDNPRPALWHLGILMGEIARQRSERDYLFDTGMDMKFSRQEIRYLQFVAQAADKIAQLEISESGSTPLLCYRYFREMGQVGVDCALAAAAGAFAVYLDEPDGLTTALDTCRDLLDAWYQHPSDWINPPALMRGEDVMAALNAAPGPLIGRLLEEIREKQVTGEISTRADAEEWLKTRHLLE
jgi:poly(A) polymerase